MQTMNLSESNIGGFEEAKRVAREAARKRLGEDPILWAWHDALTDRHSPPVNCCGSEAKPAWEVYARVRGGDLKVSVGGRYDFYFGRPCF